jgi:cardiolipin synthase
VSLRQLPNLICIARMLLVLPIAMLLYEERYGLTLVLFAVAAFSDALDGFLAKHFGWTTELGKMLDPLADKLLLVTVFIMVAVTGLAPVWLTVTVVARDVVIGFGSLAYQYLFGPLQGRPTGISKVNTAVQLLFILAVVSSQGLGWPPQAVNVALGALVFVTTVISGIDYVTTYVRRARGVVRARRVQNA